MTEILKCIWFLNSLFFFERENKCYWFQQLKLCLFIYHFEYQ